MQDKTLLIVTSHSDIIILKTSFELWEKLDPQFREMFEVLRVEPDDYDKMKGDETYQELYSEYRKTKKKLDNFKFDFRNK